MSSAESAPPNPGVARPFEALLQEHDEALLALMMLTQRRGALLQEKKRKMDLVARYGSFLDDDAGGEMALLDQTIIGLDRELVAVNDLRRERGLSMAELVESKSKQLSSPPSPPPPPPAADNGINPAMMDELKSEINRRFQKYDATLEKTSGDLRELRQKNYELLGENSSLRGELKKQMSAVESLQKDREEIAALKSTVSATKQRMDAALSDLSSQVQGAIQKTQMLDQLQKLKEDVQKMNLQAEEVSKSQRNFGVHFASEKASIDSRIEQIDKRLTQAGADRATIVHPTKNGVVAGMWPVEIERRLAEHQMQLRSLFERMDRTTMREIALPIVRHVLTLVMQHPSILQTVNNNELLMKKSAQHDEDVMNLRQRIFDIDVAIQKAIQEIQQINGNEESGSHESQIKDILQWRKEVTDKIDKLAQLDARFAAYERTLTPSADQDAEKWHPNASKTTEAVKLHPLTTSNLPSASTGKESDTPTSAKTPTTSTSTGVQDLGKGLFEIRPRPLKRPRVE